MRKRRGPASRHYFGAAGVTPLSPETNPTTQVIDMRAFLLAAVLCTPVTFTLAHDDSAPVPAKDVARNPLRDTHGDPLPPGAIARLGTLRWRTTTRALSLTFSPDGKRLASTDRHWVRLWDVASGKEIGSAAAHNVAHTVFTRDGSRILFAEGHTLVILDSRDAHEVGSYKLDGYATGVSLHPRESYAAVITREGGIYLAPSDQVVPTALQQLTQLPGRYLLVAAWAADGKTLAVADSGGKLWLLDASAAGRVLGEFAIGSSTPRGLAFAPDGKALVLIADSVTQWVDAATGKIVRTFTPHAGTAGWWLSPDGRQLAGASNSSKRVVHVWDTQTGELLYSSQHPLVTPGTESALAFSPDGTVGASADGHLLCLWEVKTGKPLLTHQGHSRAVEELSFLAGGRQVVTNSVDGRAAVWDADTGKLLREWEHEDQHPFRVPHCFAGDGSLLVTREQGGLCLWDLAAGKAERRPVPADSGWALRDVAMSGKTVVLGTTRGVLLWDIKKGKVLQRLAVANPVGWLALSPDEKRLAEVWDSAMAVWDVDSGKRLWQLKEENATDRVSLLAWTPDGREVLVERGHLQTDRFAFLDAATGRQQGRLKCWDSGFQSVAFSADGRRLATASKQGVVRLWETATRLELGRFTPWRPSADGGPGQAYEHIRLAFDPSGLRLATAVDDGTVLVYSLPRLFATGGDALDASAWDVLASGDGKMVFALMMRMTQRPAGAVALFKKRLVPAPGVAEKRLQELLADLDANDFARRQAASQELVKLGDVCEGALRTLLEKPPSLEAKRRAELVLEALAKRFSQFPSPAIRVERALQVLEGIGSPEAREVLQALAKGDPRARQTQQAQAALERLKRRA
jgi:WD40 repeat protein